MDENYDFAVFRGVGQNFVSMYTAPGRDVVAGAGVGGADL